MADQSQQPKSGGDRRYGSFEEFSDHFYGSSGQKKGGDEQNASFGFELSRDLVRQNLAKSSKKAEESTP